jgi:hypothetical protein
MLKLVSAFIDRFFYFYLFIFIAKEKLAHVAEDVKVSGKDQLTIVSFFILNRILF